MASELLIGPGVTLEYCQMLAEEVPFERFEETFSGDIGIGDTIFKMRIGLHMQRPMQAIIAHRQFIKMRPETRFNERRLLTLDALSPDTCLYNKSWSPDPLYTQGQMNERDTIIFDYAPTVNALLERGIKGKTPNGPPPVPWIHKK